MRFIKIIQLQLLLTLFIFTVACKNTEKPKIADMKIDVLKHVDPMIGTGSHGHTFPGAAMPHGRVQLSPDTHLLGWEASSGYHYKDTTLYGFSHTHLSGTGIGDLGDFLFLPFTDNFPEEKPVATLSHDEEIAEAGYYKINVAPWDITAELAATSHTGWHRYTFPEDKDANIMIDLGHILQPNWGHKLLESKIRIVDEYTIKGYRKTSGWAAKDPVWFTCVFDQPIITHQIKVNQEKSKKTKVSGKNIIGYFSFGKVKKPINVKVAISAVDQSGADMNMQQTKALQSFDQVVKNAQSRWRRELGKITIETKRKEVLKNFYTALYHTKLAPMTYSDLDGRYRGMDGEIHRNTLNKRYTAYSLWDTYRSWYPLMTIIEPKLARDWAYDLHAHAKEGGLLPKWPLNGNYTGTMVGYPAVAIMADAFEKGIIDSISNNILKTTVKSSKWQPEFYKKHKGTRAEMVMPKQIYFKEKLGFVPLDSCKESVSYGLEMAYYDWCIARMAKKTGKKQLAAEYFKKGKAYREYFDPEIQFMRGKNADGSWSPDFNPNYSNHLESEFVEGNSWQWTPFLPHAVEDFATMLGGKEDLGEWLDRLFTTESTVEGENASADITGLIGQYAHGNEPSHHVPFMYHFSDRPWRTQEVLDSIMTSFYSPTPEGIIGNEDCGQMSAWYVLNAIGIYQMTAGKGLFTVGRPLVDRAQIKVEKGVFSIEVSNNSKENKYIKKVVLNDKLLKNNTLNYKDIKAGNTLYIYMTNKP